MPVNRDTLQSRDTARSSSPNNFDQKLKEALAANASLEKEKFRLMEAIAKDKKLVQELDQQITILNAQVVERKLKLASYNALFLRMKDAEVKAPKQKFGLRDAVLGTKRVIDKELDRLAKEAVTIELKLNRAKDKNNVLRSQINTFRREHVTFRRLFDQMQQELADVKKAIQDTEANIEAGYQQRSRAHEEMKEVLRQFEQDRLERQQDWIAATEELENAGTIVATRPAEGNTGGRKGQGGAMLSPSEQEHLKKKIVRGQTKIQKDRSALHFHQKKSAAFAEALDRIKERTGHSRIQDIINLFNAMEERKFSRAQIAQRLVAEIERLEQDTSQLRGEVQDRELENARLKADRAAAVGQLNATALDLESQVADVNESARQAFNEIKALFRVVEFAFRCLGVQNDLLEAPPGSPTYTNNNTNEAFPFPSPAKWPGGPDSPVMSGARGPIMRAESTVSLSEFREKTNHSLMPFPSPTSPDSNSRMSMRRQGSIGMYTSSATQQDALRSGVSAGSLGMHVGIIENKAAEILQQFAVAATRGELVTESDLDRLEGLDENALMARELAIKEGREVDSLGLPSDLELRPISADVLGMSMAQRQQLRRRSAAFAAGSGEMARRILLPGGLGPSEPPGKVKESIATSALVASLAMDSGRIIASNNDDLNIDDDARPLPVGELKEEAFRRLQTDKSIKALKTAAGAAAAALIAAGPSAPTAK